MTETTNSITKAVQTIETAILKADTADKDGYYKRLFGSAMGSLRELEAEIARLQHKVDMWEALHG